MADKNAPKTSSRPAKQGGVRKEGGGWEKKVVPPSKGVTPPGPKPKK
jgi:hypothetical protein